MQCMLCLAAALLLLASCAVYKDIMRQVTTGSGQQLQTFTMRAGTVLLALGVAQDVLKGWEAGLTASAVLAGQGLLTAGLAVQLVLLLIFLPQTRAVMRQAERLLSGERFALGLLKAVAGLHLVICLLVLRSIVRVIQLAPEKPSHLSMPEGAIYFFDTVPMIWCFGTYHLWVKTALRTHSQAPS